MYMVKNLLPLTGLRYHMKIHFKIFMSRFPKTNDLETSTDDRTFGSRSSHALPAALQQLVSLFTHLSHAVGACQLLGFVRVITQLSNERRTSWFVRVILCGRWPKTSFLWLAALKHSNFLKVKSRDGSECIETLRRPGCL